MISLLASLILFHPVLPTSEWAERARELLDSGETSAALEVLEKQREVDETDAELWRLLGNAYLRLATEWQEAGSNSFLPLQDASTAFERALLLDPLDLPSLRSRFDVLLQLGEYGTAYAVASMLVGRSTMERGVASDWAVENSALARVLTESVQGARDPAADARGCAEAVAMGRRVLEDNPQALSLAVELGLLLQSRGLLRETVDHLARSVAADPEAVVLHQRLIDLHFFQDQMHRLPALYGVLFGAEGGSATVQWYRGYVNLLAGDDARREWRLRGAGEHYRRCVEWMRSAASAEAGYEESARRISHLASLGLGAVLMKEGRLDEAAETFYRLLEESPDLLDVEDGLKSTVALELGVLCFEFEKLRQFEKAVEVSRAMVVASPEDAQWWNNLGYFLREFATQVEGGAVGDAGDPRQAARVVFEDSWQSYRKAAQLAPQDARIVNDAALIQVYHLESELDLAIEMLFQSIEVGEQQLRDLGPDPEEETRFPLAQAVGDAYQNLGYLYYHLRPDFEKSRLYYEKSIATDSGDRSQMQDYIDAIEGKREKMPREDISGSARVPLANPPPRGLVRWESGWNSALARGAAESRPIFVYHRGAGLGLSVPFYDQFVRSERFAAISASVVPVVADPSRHTIADRRRDGRPLACPKYGGPPCGAHVTVARELTEALQSEQRGGLEENLYLFLPDGTLHESESRLVNNWIDEAQELLGEPRPGPHLDRLEATLADYHVGSRRTAITQLWRSSLSEGPQRVEGLLFDSRTSPDLQQDILGVLGEFEDERTRSLLQALATGAQDAALRRAAVAALDPEADRDALLAALRWDEDEGVRRNAARLLAPTATAGSELQRQFAVGLGVSEDPDAAIHAEALGLSGVGDRILVAGLQLERGPRVRAAVCDALRGTTSETALKLLRDLEIADGNPSVRAAAARALADR